MVRRLCMPITSIYQLHQLQSLLSPACLQSLLTFVVVLQEQLSDVRQLMQMTVDNHSKLDAARNELRPAALHGCMLYSLLSTMTAVNHMYQTSLQQFLQIMHLSLHK